MRALRLFAQLLLYLPLMAVIGFFSSRPRFEVIAPDEALVRISFVHAAERLRPCRERTPEELARLAPNMRLALDCPRERAPVLFEMELNGQVILRRSLRPSGLGRDGAAAFHHRMAVPAGHHRLVLRLRDRAEGDFNHVHEATVTLAPGAGLLVDFVAAQGGFQLRG